MPKTISTTEFKAILIREPIKAKSDEWKETAHKWAVTINGQSFDYYTGLAHRTDAGRIRSTGGFTFKELKHKSLTDIGLKELFQVSHATPPILDDVLHSLVMDSDACETSFCDWCGDFGYETDSRKALEIYLACQENATKLRKAGIDIAAERERLADY